MMDIDDDEYDVEELRRKNKLWKDLHELYSKKSLVDPFAILKQAYPWLYNKTIQLIKSEKQKSGKDVAQASREIESTYVNAPGGLEEFIQIMKRIENNWMMYGYIQPLY